MAPGAGDQAVAAAASGADPRSILQDGIVMTLSLDDAAMARQAAQELARDAARAGYSTLFVDLSPDYSGQPGLAELSTGDAAMADILSRDPYSTVHMVRAGDQWRRFSPRGFSSAFAVFAGSYDRIVVNAGLLYGEADMMVEQIVETADHAVLVVPRGELSSAEATAYDDLVAAGGLAVSVLSLDEAEPLVSAA